MNEKVKEALGVILGKFESGEIPEAIAYITFPQYDVPSARWSLPNRILMLIAGTFDARGIRQWNKVGRKVKKGAKSFSILAPRIITKESGNGVDTGELNPPGDSEQNTETEIVTTKVLAGFLTVPVFRVEDTEGEPLAYEKLEVPGLPLMKVAEQWGISVKGVPWDGHLYGYFDQYGKEIALASEEEAVFFHELAHAAHQRVLGEKLKGGQDWKQEIVAELSAAVLCHLYGKDPSKHLGNNYRYIARYAEEAGVTPVQGCYRVLNDVEKVLGLIIRQASA